MRHQTMRYILHILATCLIIQLIQGCKTSSTYTLTQEGSDQILEGSVQKDVLNNKKLFPWFGYFYDTYKPDTALLRLLAEHKGELSVLVVGGTWCSDTQRELPRLLKIKDLAGIPDTSLQLIMVNRQKKCRSFHTEVYRITKVPTIIFMMNGKETGRVIEQTTTTLEEEWVRFCGLK